MWTSVSNVKSAPLILVSVLQMHTRKGSPAQESARYSFRSRVILQARDRWNHRSIAAKKQNRFKIS